MKHLLWLDFSAAEISSLKLLPVSVLLPVDRWPVLQAHTHHRSSLTVHTVETPRLTPGFGYLPVTNVQEGNC